MNDPIPLRRYRRSRRPSKVTIEDCWVAVRRIEQDAGVELSDLDRAYIAEITATAGVPRPTSRTKIGASVYRATDGAWIRQASLAETVRAWSSAGDKLDEDTFVA